MVVWWFLLDSGGIVVFEEGCLEGIVCMYWVLYFEN